MKEDVICTRADTLSVLFKSGFANDELQIEIVWCQIEFTSSRRG